MHSSRLSTGRNIIGVAVILASALILPQPLLAQTANTVYGSNALRSTTGSYNSAFGYDSLYYNTNGYENTALGMQALFSNATGYNNVAVGVNALYANATGSYNTANGVNALYANSTGSNNTASGVSALYANSTGSDNTVSGSYALYSNTIGNSNTASGIQALYFNTSGDMNTASGAYALYHNTTGSYNTANGLYALSSNTTGSKNIAMGNGSGINLTTGSDNIDIGNTGNSADNATVRIGISGVQAKTFMAGISGVYVGGGVQVYINSAGQLGTMNSSRRFKKDIKSIDSVSDKLLQLRPVSFVYKEDKSKQLQYGLIAEEVAKVYPELVQFGKDGKPVTVYYNLLTPLLLSELQKEHEKISVQQTEVASLNQQLSAQHAEMVAMLQQQKQQMAEMTALQHKISQMEDLQQANSTSAVPSAKVALVISH